MGYKYIVLAVLLALSHGGMFWLGGRHAVANAAEDKLDTIMAQVEGQKDWQAELQKKLDNLPKSENKVREIVREYPAPCPMPEPVAHGLRQAVDEANASRALP